MEKKLFIKFPIMGKGNPLKNVVLLHKKIKDDLGIEAVLGNADAGDFEVSPAPYALILGGKIIWSGQKIDTDSIIEAIKANF